MPYFYDDYKPHLHIASDHKTNLYARYCIEFVLMQFHAH